MRKSILLLILAMLFFTLFFLEIGNSQDAKVSIEMVSEAWWNDSIKASGVARRNDEPVNLSSVEIFISGKNVCENMTDENGYYSCEFNAPLAIGIYEVLVKVTDSQTGEIITNTTELVVKLGYGESKKEEISAKRISCYELPKIIQNPNGSIKRAIVRICVWR
jgi:hypothetical protein